MLSPEAMKEKDLYIQIFCDLSFSHMDKTAYKISAPDYVIFSYIERAKKEPIYRIVIHDDNGVTTTCYEMLDNFAPELKSFYETVDELPKWVQDKIAVLMLLDHTKQNQEVENVGRRISKDIYWVFKGETDGVDP